MQSSDGGFAKRMVEDGRDTWRTAFDALEGTCGHAIRKERVENARRLSSLQQRRKQRDAY